MLEAICACVKLPHLVYMYRRSNAFLRLDYRCVCTVGVMHQLGFVRLPLCIEIQ